MNLHRCADTVRALKAHVRRRLRRARDWVSWVLERLRHEPGYAEAIAAVAVAATELLARGPRTPRLVRDSARLLVAVLRSRRRDATVRVDEEPPPGPW